MGESLKYNLHQRIKDRGTGYFDITTGVWSTPGRPHCTIPFKIRLDYALENQWTQITINASTKKK